MQLEHIAINVPAPAEMAKWYAENLDMHIVRQSAEAPYMHFLADQGKESMIEIYSNPDADVPNYASLDPLIFHIAFYADNIEAKRDQLVAAGATVVGAINETPAGDRLLFLRDPWGITLQLVTRQKPML